MCTPAVASDAALDNVVERLHQLLEGGDVPAARASLQEAAFLRQRAWTGLAPRARAVARALDSVAVLLDDDDVGPAMELVADELSRAIGGRG